MGLRPRALRDRSPVALVVTLETGDGDRERNMWAFTKAALQLLESSLGRR